MSNFDTFIAELKAGAYDGQLEQVHKAIKLRVDGGAVGFRWKIELPDGPTVTEDDITLGELERVEAETGMSWLLLNPIRSARAFSAIARAAFVCRDGLSEADAKKRVADLQAVGTVRDCISEYEVQFPPFDRAASAPT